MREETKEFLKENIGKINQRVHEAKEKVDLGFIEKKLIKLYFKSPAKVQFALARFGIKAVMNKNKKKLDELIRH